VLPPDALIPDRRASAPDSERFYLLVWFGLLTIAALSTLSVYAQIANTLSHLATHISADFIVFWTAVQAPQPYDVEALTKAQYWYMHTETLRPFAYPPSFLPWIEPFGLLPMRVAYLVWTASTAALFLLCWRGLVDRTSLAIAAAAPAFVLAALPGQAVFLLGALLVGGLRLVERRPILAGLLLGLAATIKPQAALLIPVALVAGRHWRALQAAAISGTAVGAACLLLQGVDLWRAWLQALPEFLKIVRETGMTEFGITPASFLANARIEGPLATFISVSAALLALATLWRTFALTNDMLCRVLALNAATLLVLPYAMPYELALSAPAAAALLLNRRLHPIATFAAFLMFTTAGKGLATVVMCLVLLWASTRGGSLLRQTSATIPDSRSDPRPFPNAGAATS
jgi:hypothetical protein